MLLPPQCGFTPGGLASQLPLPVRNTPASKASLTPRKRRAAPPPPPLSDSLQRGNRAWAPHLFPNRPTVLSTRRSAASKPLVRRPWHCGSRRHPQGMCQAPKQPQPRVPFFLLRSPVAQPSCYPGPRCPALPDASGALLEASTHLSYLLWPEGHTTVLQSHSGAHTGCLEA